MFLQDSYDLRTPLLLQNANLRQPSR